MTERDIIRAYYRRVASAGFPHAAEHDDGKDRLKAVSIRGCHGNSTNLLFFCVEVDNGIISRIGYDCQYCDVIMYVTAELICELSVGRAVADLGAIDDSDLAAALGGTSKKVLRQTRTSFGLLRDGLLVRSP